MAQETFARIRARPLVLLFIGTAAGILIGLPLAGLLPAVGCILLLTRYPLTHPLPLLLAGLAFGLIRSAPPPEEVLQDASPGPTHRLSGEVLDLDPRPDVLPGTGFGRLTLRAYEVDGRPTRGHVRVFWFGSAPGVEVGADCRLLVSRLDDRGASLVHADPLPGPAGLRTRIWRVRMAVRDSLHRTLEPRTAGVLCGLVLGIRSGVPADLQEDLRRTGAAHLLVISGLHFAIVFAVIGTLARFLVPGRGWWIVAVAWAGVYALLAGLSIPVIRAFVMASLYLVGDRWRRPADPLNLLAGAAIVNLAVDPAALASLSFQLSFLAVLGILTLARRIPNRWLSVSIACTLFTLPLTAHYFGIVTPIVVVANLLLTPLLILVLFAGWIPGVTPLFEWSASMLAATPLSHVYIIPPGIGWVVLYYVLLLPSLRKPWLTALLPLLLLIPHWTGSEGNGVTQVGEAVVCSRKGRVLVYADRTGWELQRHLAARGIDSIDVLASPSLPDPRFLGRFRPRRVIRPGQQGRLSIDGWEWTVRSPDPARWGRAAVLSARPLVLSSDEVTIIGRTGVTARSIIDAESPALYR